jgi:hypothetical protein
VNIDRFNRAKRVFRKGLLVLKEYYEGMISFICIFCFQFAMDGVHHMKFVYSNLTNEQKFEGHFVYLTFCVVHQPL